MFQFGDHNSAMQTAALSLKTLMDAEEAETISEQEKEMNMIWKGEYPEETLESSEKHETGDDSDLAASPDNSDQTPRAPVELSRRDFLRGRQQKQADESSIASAKTEQNR